MWGGAGADARAEPLSEGENIQLLEKVISDQRGILSKVFNTSDVSTIPQMWCLCESSPLFHAGRPRR